MSILEFMEMTIPECIFFSILAIVVCIAYSGIGYYFAPKQGLIIQAVIGMTFMSAVGTIFAGFCAIVVKYLIIIFGIIGGVVLWGRLKQNSLQIQKVIVAILPIVVLYSIIFIHIISFILPRNGFFPYNGHLTYFSSVPLELLKADYFGRIRMMDVFPFEWSKYHFFNGAYIAIPLIVFAKKNFVSYLLAKMVGICFYVGAIFDLLKRKYGYKRAVVELCLGIITIFASTYIGFSWSVGTNNYSSIFMLILAWLLFEEKEYGCATLFSMGLALTKVGSVFSGSGLLLYGIYKIASINHLSFFKLAKKYRKEVEFCAVVGVAIITMVLLGKMGVLDGAIGSILSNVLGMFSAGWMYLMPMGKDVVDKRINFGNLEYTFLLVMLYLIIRNKSNLKENLHDLIVKYKKILIFFIGIYILYLLGVMYVLKDIVYVLFALVVWFVLPAISLLSVVKNEEKELLIFYVGSLAVSFVCFNAGAAVPNYYIIVFILLIFFVRQFASDFYEQDGSSRILLYVLIFVGGICWIVPDYQKMFFLDKKDVYYEELELEFVKYTDEPFEYNSLKDDKEAKLNALKANRVHYNVLPNPKDETMKHISITMRLLPEGYEEDFQKQLNIEK